jgi:hypothetical protein
MRMFISPGPRCFWRAALAGGVLALLPVTGRAEPVELESEGRPSRIATELRSGWYLPVGFDLGVGWVEGRAAPTLGLEASLVRLDAHRLFWMGSYVRAVQALPARATRLSLGSEMGIMMNGLELGPVVELRDGQMNPGAEARLMLSLTYVTFYAGGTWLFAQQRRELQLGMLVKLPVVLSVSGPVVRNLH